MSDEPLDVAVLSRAPFRGDNAAANGSSIALLAEYGGKRCLLAADAFAPVMATPLVFLNACDSAELSPFFYDDFVSFFVARGARGAIGTECKIPAVFAAEWAKRFFTEFLPGKCLGQLFLDLRREFYLKHNNLLGLAYALYCDGDTQVLPGLSVG